MESKSRVITGLVVSVAFLGSAFYFAVPTDGNRSIQGKTRPNIIVILADDLGYGDLFCYNRQSQINTPNLNRFSRESLRFTDAHSGSSVCTPTRYGMLTGRYAFRSPLKKGVLGGYSPSLIEKDRFTVADLLKRVGYQTAVIGKWHLGADWPAVDPAVTRHIPDPPDWPSAHNVNLLAGLTQGPNDLGFDYSYILPGGADLPPYMYLENGKPIEGELEEIAGNESPRGVFWRKGLGSKGFRVHDILDTFGDKAQEYLTQRSRQQQPFFLYLALTSPHTPWVPSSDFRGKSKAGTYGDFVAHTDAIVGRLLLALDQAGLKENTLIIFTSDNGADWKPGDQEKFPEHQANYIYRGQKSDIWEGGHRIPFMLRWPPLVRKAGTVDQTICLTDLMATFAALTGQTLPANAAQDSFDFSGLLNREVSAKPVRPSIIHHSYEGLFAIRQGKWKYVDGIGSGGWSKPGTESAGFEAQLYDLEKDIKETTNLLRKHPDVAVNLRNALHQQQRRGYSRPGAAP